MTMMGTLKDNMEKAADLLANDDDKVDLDYLRAIVGTAMNQQSKAASFQPESLHVHSAKSACRKAT
jgi:hypothetical protein